MKAALIASIVLGLGLAASDAGAKAKAGRRRGPDAGDVVANALKGRVFLTAKRAPTHFPNASAWIRFLQANRKEHIWPEKNNKKQWRFEFMAFWARPLNDLEVTVKIYDVTDVRRLVVGDSFYLPQKGQRLLAANMTLDQPRFEVNRKYEMRVTDARQQQLAATKFWLRGEKERYSGKVTFSDEDTRKKDEED
jgi:hypothetical protein